MDDAQLPIPETPFSPLQHQTKAGGMAMERRRALTTKTKKPTSSSSASFTSHTRRPTALAANRRR